MYISGVTAIYFNSLAMMSLFSYFGICGLNIPDIAVTYSKNPSTRLKKAVYSESIFLITFYIMIGVIFEINN